MSILRNTALGVWYYSTLPWRRRAARQGSAPITILFYHRVADQHPNPWTITNRSFARQIRWLRRNFDLISLAEAQRRLRTGDSPRAAVSITFDDGYAENCEQALPLLIRERIPFTYFVASRFVLEGRPFPHDVEAGRLLSPNTPEQIRELAQAGAEIGSHTRTHSDLGHDLDERALRDEILGAREDLAAMTGRPVRYFAFPYGQPCNLNAEAFLLAREASFEAACSAYGGYNLPGGDAFHLQRCHGDTHLLKLKNWATVDPRKHYTVMPFHYRRLALEANQEGAAR